ncbi:MAG: hypothetical protein F6K54_37305 [Okeania sp. SIO3B5]|uniref:hypothetical protein n=1 Tax=Okeania sp. SIO3B5 TaxID=2607811 RepID=UPI0013FEC50B|nr:hypothetical protein [Okeania sp. SIO3B5]NEO58219.1 hypothetical protein [Okeania sp. SIO3B5]
MKEKLQSPLRFIFAGGVGGAVSIILILLTWNFVFDKDKVKNSNTYESKNNQIEIKGNENSGITQNGTSTTNNNSKQYDAKNNNVKIEGESNIGILQGTIDQRPRYEDVNILQGSSPENFIPLHSSQDESTATQSFKVAEKLLSGEQIGLDEAFGEIFSIQTPIKSGTAVEILENPAQSNSTNPDSSFENAKNKFLKMAKVKVLEGPEKGRIGWVSVATIATEQRLISE